MKLLRRLWSDDVGFIVTSELVLLSSTMVLGLVVGAQTIRDSVLQEVGDVAAAIGNLSQDYSFAGARGHFSETNGSVFLDQPDAADCPGNGGTQSAFFRTGPFQTVGFRGFGGGGNCVQVGVPPDLVE